LGNSLVGGTVGDVGGGWTTQPLATMIEATRTAVKILATFILTFMGLAGSLSS
jgi:hypothetical protein